MEHVYDKFMIVLLYPYYKVLSSKHQIIQSKLIP